MNPQTDHNLATPRTALHACYVTVRLTCWSCRHWRHADLQALIDDGRGDVPLIHLQWRCANCGSRRIDMVVSGQAHRPAHLLRAADPITTTCFSRRLLVHRASIDDKAERARGEQQYFSG